MWDGACRFDRAIKAFVKRCKEGRKPGFPRTGGGASRYRMPLHLWWSLPVPRAGASGGGCG